VRITVECGGFTRAAEACLTANQTGAVLTRSLASRLAGRAGMASNDATSSSFAAAYDAGAREALAALADLTHAFIGAVRLLAATGDNHALAESAASGADTPVVGYVDRLTDSAFVRVLAPSSLGAQEPSLGTVDAWILDRVEGFVWPGADVVALRAAGSAWRRESDFTYRLVGAAPELTPLLDEHLADQEGELLAYVFMADVSRWLFTTSTANPGRVREVLEWLESEFSSGDFDVRNLIDVGIVEMFPAAPEGVPVLAGLLSR
jgi:hypothetical protein